MWCCAQTPKTSEPAARAGTVTALDGEVEAQIEARTLVISKLKLERRTQEAHALIQSTLAYCKERRHSVGQAMVLLMAGSPEKPIAAEAEQLLDPKSSDVAVRLARAICCRERGVGLLVAGDNVAAASKLNECLALLDALGDNQAALLPRYLKDPAEVRSAALEAAVQVNGCNEDSRLESLSDLANILLLRGQHTEALAKFQELNVAGAAYARRVLECKERGDGLFLPPDAEKGSVALAMEVQVHLLRGHLGCAACCKQLGRYPEAKTAIETALRFGLRRDAPPSVLPVVACLIGERGWLSLRVDDHKTGEGSFELMLEFARDLLGNTELELQALQGLAACLTNAGRHDDAARVLDEHRALATKTNDLFMLRKNEEARQTLRWKQLPGRGIPEFRWHAAMVRAVVAAQPDLIKTAIEEVAGGTFRVAFREVAEGTTAPGKVEWVAVDASFPVSDDGRTVAGTIGSIWCALHEKALAKYLAYLGQPIPPGRDANDVILTYQPIVAAPKNMTLERVLAIMFGDDLRPEVRAAALAAGRPDWDRLAQAPPQDPA